MSEELRNREAQARSAIETLLTGMDASARELYESLLNDDVNHELTEEQSVAQLEGFHDYVVVREALGVEHPTLNDFLDIRRANPESLLSFGTGRRRAEVAENNDVIDDTVSDEEYANEVSYVDAAEEASAVRPEEVLTDAYASPVSHGVVDHTESPDEGELNKYVSEGGAVSDAVSADSPDETEPDDGQVETDGEDETANEDEIVEDVADDETPDESSDEEEAQESGASKAIPGRIDATAVATKEFATKRGGYNLDQVDDLLDEVAEFLKQEHSVEEYQAMVVHLEANQFKASAFSKGFSQAEVDGFVEAIISELRNRSTS